MCFRKSRSHSGKLGPKIKMSERIGKQAERQKKAKESLYYKADAKFHYVMFKLNTLNDTDIPRI